MLDVTVKQMQEDSQQKSFITETLIKKTTVQAQTPWF